MWDVKRIGSSSLSAIADWSQTALESEASRRVLCGVVLEILRRGDDVDDLFAVAAVAVSSGEPVSRQI